MALGATFPRFCTANQKQLFESAGIFVLYNLHNFYGEGFSASFETHNCARTHLHAHAHVEWATDPSPSPLTPEANLRQIKRRAHYRELSIHKKTLLLTLHIGSSYVASKHESEFDKVFIQTKNNHGIHAWVLYSQWLTVLPTFFVVVIVLNQLRKITENSDQFFFLELIN